MTTDHNLLDYCNFEVEAMNGARTVWVNKHAKKITARSIYQNLYCAIVMYISKSH